MSARQINAIVCDDCNKIEIVPFNKSINEVMDELKQDGWTEETKEKLTFCPDCNQKS